LEKPTFFIFERLANRYDSWYVRNRIIAENEVKLVKLFPPKPPSVEVGAGTGYFASKLAVDVAVEPAYNMLVKAHERGLETIQALGENLPIRSGSIATVYLIVTLCFLDNPYPVIAEIARVLKPGGSLVSCIVPRDSSWGQHYMELGRRGHPFYSRARFYTVQEMDVMYGKYGMARVKVLGTLSFKPWERARLERPKPWRPGMDLGFICAEYRKVSS
jgi:SAM-dependent methyltransferase